MAVTLALLTAPGCAAIDSSGTAYPTWDAGKFPDIHWRRTGKGGRCLDNADYQALRAYVIRLHAVNKKHRCVIETINGTPCKN